MARVRERKRVPGGLRGSVGAWRIPNKRLAPVNAISKSAVFEHYDVTNKARLILPRQGRDREAAPLEHRLGEANTLRAIGDVLQFQKT